MGCCCGRTAASRVLPAAREDQDEYAEFQRLIAEDVGPGNSLGWSIKKDWPKNYKNDFMMRVCLRPHDSKNPNMFLRGDGKYRGVKPADFLNYLLNPDNRKEELFELHHFTPQPFAHAAPITLASPLPSPLPSPTSQSRGLRRTNTWKICPTGASSTSK
jgi:hypothetical protein